MSSNTSVSGKKVTLEEARIFISNYQNETMPPAVKTNSMLLKNEFVEKILAQKDCAFLRFFMAKTTDDKSGQYTLVVVGADSTGENITEEEGTSEIYEELGLCPPTCNGGGRNL